MSTKDKPIKELNARKHLKKIYSTHDKFGAALWDARHAGLFDGIEYEALPFTGLGQLKTDIEACAKDALAKAVLETLRSER